jgi:hypothetical protein
MTLFEFRVDPALPAHALVKVDERFDVAIARSADGLEIRVYPVTDGEIWFDPYDTLNIEEAVVIALEKEMEG